MNVEIGTEAAQVPEKEHINGIFFAVHSLGFKVKMMSVVWLVWKVKSRVVLDWVETSRVAISLKIVTESGVARVTAWVSWL
jgi:hypothetical protein